MFEVVSSTRCLGLPEKRPLKSVETDFVVTKVMLGVDEHSGILRINIKERLCKILFLRKIILILYRIQVIYNNASKNEYFM